MENLKRVVFLSLSGVAVLIFGVAVLASTPQIKINSWQAIGNLNSQLAEVCGTVTGATQNPVFLEVIPDYNTKNPGYYHTVAGTNGNFCQVVRTLYGSIQVVILNSSAPGAKATSKFR